MKKTGLLLSLLPLWLLLTGFYLLEPRIIGGEDETETPPFLAFMVVEFNDGQRQSCGASYIAERVAITAAHCLHNPQNDLATRVKLAFNPADGDRRNLSDEDYVEVSWFDIFPGYDNENFVVRDAALLYLTEAPADVEPIGLASASLTESLEADRAEVTAYGWGLTEPGVNDSASDVLQKVNLRMDNRNSYDNESAWNQLGEWVVFAGSTDDDKDTCQGDSGGPLVYFQGENPVLVGITSFGPQQCAMDNQPGGYARVARILDWAEDLDVGLFKLQDTVLARRVDESAGALSPLTLLLLAPALVAVVRRRRARSQA